MMSKARSSELRLPGPPPPPADVGSRLWRLARRVVQGGSRRLLRVVGLGPPVLCYEDWIRDRLAARLIDYPPVTPPVTFSILTPVYDTPPRFLRALAESVLSQDDSTFEWVIVDNGSTRWGTRRVLRRLEREPCVHLIREPKNRGIVHGTRTALLHAKGQYVVPVDHDDVLYPDALRVMANYIRDLNEPAILYSDEDKLLRGKPACPFFKPDWDPALFLNCCYVTHLSAIRRELAVELHAYTDPDAEGCPDWDTYGRFIRAGHTPVHVPEILYSWRVHPASTSSLEAGAKSYAVESQERVLRKHISQHHGAEQHELQSNPLFSHTGMWWPKRRRTAGPIIHVNLVTAGNPETLNQCLEKLAESDYPNLDVRVTGDIGPAALMQARGRVEVCPWKGRHTAWLADALPTFSANDLVVTWRDDYLPIDDEWPWEMVGLFERHQEAVAVCGRFYDAAGVLERAGEVFGYRGLAGSPIVGPHFPPSGYHGLLFCQRTVSVVTPMFFAARAGFVSAALAGAPQPPSWETLGLWLGAHAQRSGGRILYSPHIVCRRVAKSDWPRYRSDDEVLAFLQQHADLLAEDRCYGRHFSLKDGEGYLLTTPEQREVVLRATLSQLRGARPFTNLGVEEASSREAALAETRS